jgi:hypothetical protein
MPERGRNFRRRRRFLMELSYDTLAYADSVDSETAHTDMTPPMRSNWETATSPARISLPYSRSAMYSPCDPSQRFLTSHKRLQPSDAHLEDASASYTKSMICYVESLVFVFEVGWRVVGEKRRARPNSDHSTSPMRQKFGAKKDSASCEGAGDFPFASVKCSVPPYRG